MLRDGTGLCQCVVESSAVDEASFEAVKRAGQESSLRVTGLVREEPRSPGGHELAVTAIEVVCSASDYPITPKEHGVDFLLKNRHLHLRSLRPWCIGRIRHTVIDAIRRFFNDNGFTLVDTPIFTTDRRRRRADAVRGGLLRPARCTYRKRASFTWNRPR
jgi:asparaginyl-tRNA synthetase